MERKTGKTKPPSKESPLSYIKTVIAKLNAMDDTLKFAALGGGCLVLLLFLYCIYRMCCASGPSIEEEAEYLRRVKKATPQPPSPRKADTSGSASRDSKDSRPTTPVIPAEGRRTPPLAPWTPSRQRTEEWDPGRRDLKMKGERTTQDDQPTMETAAERGHRRRIHKATRRLKRLLRLTREETKQVGAGPPEDVQANILDAMGSVESPGMGFTAPTATGGSTGTSGTGGQGEGGYEQVMPFMPETQRAADAPKW